MESEITRLLFLDDEAGQQDVDYFGINCSDEFETIKGLPLQIHSTPDPDLFLEQLSRGDPPAHALLLDISFSKLRDPSLRWVDPPHSAKNRWGIDILRTIRRIDPDFPVVVLTSVPGQEVSFAAGRFGAYDFFSKARLLRRKGDADEHAVALEELCKRVLNAREICERRSVYDHKHLTEADRFAKVYDDEERKKTATVAYYHFENEWIGNILTGLLRSASPSEKIMVLDVGCGTGRIEEFLCRQEYRDRVEVVGVDFSGKMLCEAYDKFRRLDESCLVEFGRRCASRTDGGMPISFFRAPVENLEFLKTRYPRGFDLAVLGFGFLSYVRYSEALPASVQLTASTGLVSLLKEGGKLLFSVYNENSAIYSRVATLDSKDKDLDLSIAALMDLRAGRLKVGENRYFQCEAFTRPRIARFIRQAGLFIDVDRVTTFPTIHLALRNSEAAGFPLDPDFSPGRFNRALYDLDREVSRVLPDCGHYIVGEAWKVS